MDVEAEHFEIHEESLIQPETGLLDETADIESLKSAYWSVVGQSGRIDRSPQNTQSTSVNFITPGRVNAPSTHQGSFGVRTEWATTAPCNNQHPEKLFPPLKLALGILCLGLASVFIFMGWGDSWMSHQPQLQTNEPVNLLILHDSEKMNSTSGNSGLNYIRRLQENLADDAPNSPSTKNNLLAQVWPTENGALRLTTEKAPIEPVGRDDPFAPLVSLEPVIESSPAVKVDILANLQYTGFIGDINATEKMALLKVSDPASGTASTTIKKEGESWLLNGETVTIKSISKSSIYLSAQGESRQLQIQPFQTAKATPSSAGDIKNTRSTPKKNSVDTDSDDFEREYP